MENTMKINYQSFITRTSEDTINFQKMAMLPHIVRWKIRYHEFENDNGEMITAKAMLDLLPYDWNCETPKEYNGKYRILSFHFDYDQWEKSCHKIYEFLHKQLEKNYNTCINNPSIKKSDILAF